MTLSSGPSLGIFYKHISSVTGGENDARKQSLTHMAYILRDWVADTNTKTHVFVSLNLYVQHLIPKVWCLEGTKGDNSVEMRL